ncbi:hypothetical protein MJO29_011637 [Puccinia striiformis f. sp. tritici]|nr:hypothetical protein MJO29_011637 [Puccinia striiformis f. sp. tritici]
MTILIIKLMGIVNAGPVRMLGEALLEETLPDEVTTWARTRRHSLGRMPIGPGYRFEFPISLVDV